MLFSTLVQRYKQSPHFLGLDEKSQRQYKRNLDRLLDMADDVPIKDSDMPIAVARSRSPRRVAANLTQFWHTAIDEFEIDGEPASSTVKNMLLTILKVPYRWAVATQAYLTANENPVRDIPRWTETNKPYNPYVLEEINAVKKAVKEGLYEPELEPYAVLKVFCFHCGCRPEEAFEHEFTDFTTKQGELLWQVYGGKHREKGIASREVIMGKEEKWALDYFSKQPIYKPESGAHGVADNHLDNGKYTFRTDKGKKFSKSYNCDMQKLVDEVAGIDTNHTFYDLRRGLATEMFRRGVPIRTIADRLGHKNVETTMRYIKLDATGRSLSSPYRGLT